MRAVMILLAMMTMAAPAAARETKYPELAGRVVDTADQIPPEAEATLTKELETFERVSRHQMVVVTVPDLQGVPPEEYAHMLGRHWKLGRKGVDDGIVFLQSPGDGKPGSGRIQIAVGYGLEAVLTDAEASDILSRTAIPILQEDRPKAEKVPDAIMAAARETMRVAAITPEQKAEDERRERIQRERDRQGAWDGFVAFLSWTAGIAGAIGAGVGGWLFATRKERARKRAEKAKRERLAATEAERIRAEAAKRARLARKKAVRERQEMLDAMTPEQRQRFFIEEERAQQAEIERRRAAAEEEERRRRARQAAAAAEAARQEAEEKRRARIHRNDDDDDTKGGFSGRGGSFGGGGAGASY